jgi:hypothetical protein
MNSEEKFRQSVNKLFEDADFSYDAGNWEKAKAVLDAKDRRRRAVVFITLLIGAGVIVLYMLTPLEKTTAASLAKSPVGDRESRTSSHGVNMAPAKVPEPTVDAAAQKPAIRKPVASSAEGREIRVEKRATDYEVVRPPQPAENAATSVPGNEIHGESTTVKDPVSGRGVSAQIPTVALAAGEEVVKTSAHTSIPAGEPAATASVAVDEKPDTLVTYHARMIPDSAISQVSAMSSVPDTVAATNGTETPRVSSNHVFIELGGFFNAGWTISGTREGAGINPVAGIGYFNEIGEKYAFTVGAAFTMLSHLSLDSKTIKSTRIAFGEESDVTRITPVSVNYLDLPIRIHYRTGDKQAFTVGGGMLYLLDVRSRVEEYAERLAEQENYKSYETYGYVQGFSKFVPYFSAGYRRKILDKLWINAEAVFGLSDLRDDVFFDIPHKERRMGLKLSVTYDLIRK